MITKGKLNKLSDTQLSKLTTMCKELLETRASIGALRQQALELIAESGLTVRDLLKAKPARKVKAKYVHRTDTKLTWSGRGRTPKWIKKHGVKVA